MSTRTSDFSHAPLQKEMVIKVLPFSVVLCCCPMSELMAGQMPVHSGVDDSRSCYLTAKKKELACVFLITGLIKSQKGC